MPLTRRSSLLSTDGWTPWPTKITSARAIFWLRRMPDGLALELYDIHIL
jgi:hypothetical protein